MQAWRMWIAVLGLLLFRAPNLAFARDVAISPSVAVLFVGEEKIVEGSVAAAEREGDVVRLRLGAGPRPLTVSLVIGVLSNFPNDPEHDYVGRTVRVSGKIGTFRDAPEIVVHDPANIQIVGEGSAASGTAAVAKPDDSSGRSLEEPSLSGKLDALAERLRTLEERVQSLERAFAE